MRQRPCDDHFNRSRLSALHHAVAGVLIEPPVERLNGKAAVSQRFRHLIDFVAGAGKDDRQFRAFNVQNAPESRKSVGASHHIGFLRHARRLALGRFFAGNDDVFGVV